ncbi:helix-turn-helix domain-containing protein [Halobacteriaceae archaeon GCM10025711]
MHEATLRIESDGPYAAITQGSDARVELRCNDHCDLLRVRGDDPEAMLERIRGVVGVQDHLVEGDELVAITAACLKPHDEPTIERYLAEHDCLLLPPLRYADGAKFSRVLALDPGNLTDLYRDLVDEFDVTVEAKREITTVSGDVPLLTLADALPALSTRQRQVLVAAYDRGYYRIPRETTTAEIADAIGIDRRTAEEHLRRAENKFMDTLIEYV